MRLFWERGYEATSVQDLVDSMGIERGSLYNAFGDKHSLFLTVLRRFLQQEGGKLHEILQQPGSPRAAIRKAFRSVAEQATRDCRGCLVTNSTVELAPRDREVARAIGDGISGIEDGFFYTLKRAQAAGELSRNHDTRALARFLVNAYLGIRVLARSRPERAVLKDVVATTLRVLE